MHDSSSCFLGFYCSVHMCMRCASADDIEHLLCRTTLMLSLKYVSASLGD